MELHITEKHRWMLLCALDALEDWSHGEEDDYYRDIISNIYRALDNRRCNTIKFIES